MEKIKIPIIPEKPTVVKLKNKIHELNFEAIVVFSVIGFFLEGDTYWKDEFVLQPATVNTLEDNILLESKSWFRWKYEPIQKPFKLVLEEFTDLFETIVKEPLENNSLILPLSGGLDSRTIAVALRNRHENVFSFSYSFKNGYQEHKIAQKIAEISNFKFRPFIIEEGYLWSEIEKLAEINKCQADFLNARAMFINGKLDDINGRFSLGHWGDVLFDDMNVVDNISLSEQVDIVLKKIVKKGGMELGEDLWNYWELKGDFKSYLYERIYKLLKTIDIPYSANAQIRAFKSLYWAPRWTSANIPVYSSYKPIHLPYYDNRICNFITHVPENYLSNRKIQIEYIKMRFPELANIAWQQNKPFNLYNYHYNKIPFNLPYRITNKIKRKISGEIVQRNWELQFLGQNNEHNLLKYLNLASTNGFISSGIIKKYIDLFYNSNKTKYAHTLNMLLTLAMFNKSYNKGL